MYEICTNLPSHYAVIGYRMPQISTTRHSRQLRTAYTTRKGVADAEVWQDGVGEEHFKCVCQCDQAEATGGDGQQAQKAS